MIKSIRRTSLAATAIAVIAICGIPQAQAAQTREYIGKYPTYPLCATAAQNAAGRGPGAKGWECVVNTYTHFWDAYVFTG